MQLVPDQHNWTSTTELVQLHQLVQLFWHEQNQKNTPDLFLLVGFAGPVLLVQF